MKCPCGTDLRYENCCMPYHKGEKHPSTAAATMRARYSAFVKGEITYIKETHHPDYLKDFDEEATRAWAQSAKWLGLELIRTEMGDRDDQSGMVEFLAKYSVDGREQQHHEISQFKRLNGIWFFQDGEIVHSTFKRSIPKVGRNDPCPCGSGKKFKKCCA